MYISGSGTWSTPLPGETVQLWGTQTQYDGAYKVGYVSTSTLGVYCSASNSASASTPIQCGGELMDFLLNMDVNHQEEKKLYTTLFDLLSLKKNN